MRVHCLLLLCLLPLASAVELADLARERQERLYYEEAELPPTVQALIDAPLAVASLVAHYEQTPDEKIRFNLILILDKKVRRGQYAAEAQAEAVGFFARCLQDPNPWVRTEAVYAIGNAQGRAALPAVRRHLADPSDLVAFHAAVAWHAIEGVFPALEQDQVARFERVRAALEEARGNELADAELDAYIQGQVW